MKEKIVIPEYNEFHRLNKPIMTNWVVITGPPSSGKTTLILSLKNHGNETCHDVGREVIKEYLNESKPIDEQKKQLLIEQRLINKYRRLSKNNLIFLDYGMPDNLVFQDMAGFQSQLTIKASKLIRYRAVFLLKPLAIDYDGVRTIDPVTQKRIYLKILKTYEDFGYNPIILPVVDLKTREGMVIGYIKGDIWDY